MNDKRDILLISKDVLRPDYLGCYGSRFYETPNIDRLAEKGTIFANFCTAAPSSAMAYTCMFSGLNAYELRRRKYTEVKPFDQCKTLFDILEERGYENHIIWDINWVMMAYRFSKSYGKRPVFHNLSIGQRVGPHSIKGVKIKPQVNVDPVGDICKEVKDILCKRNKPLFLWLHCPHVLKGRTGYGADIDLFDMLVGKLMDYFRNGEIYLTADHGHMNGEKGIPVYGFHVYEAAVRIPLITPNHFGQQIMEEPISNIQIKNIILYRRILKQEFVYSDTQYYAQPNRKLMIRKDDFKYIYNKSDRSEELYDLRYDPEENVNLLIESWYDTDRKKSYFLEEVYFYPRWKEAEEAYGRLRQEKNRIWKVGSRVEELLSKSKRLTKLTILSASITFVGRTGVVRERWGSKARLLRH